MTTRTSMHIREESRSHKMLSPEGTFWGSGSTAPHATKAHTQQKALKLLKRGVTAIAMGVSLVAPGHTRAAQRPAPKAAEVIGIAATGYAPALGRYSSDEVHTYTIKTNQVTGYASINEFKMPSDKSWSSQTVTSQVYGGTSIGVSTVATLQLNATLAIETAAGTQRIFVQVALLMQKGKSYFEVSAMNFRNNSQSTTIVFNNEPKGYYSTYVPTYHVILPSTDSDPVMGIIPPKNLPLPESLNTTTPFKAVLSIFKGPTNQRYGEVPLMFEVLVFPHDNLHGMQMMSANASVYVGNSPIKINGSYFIVAPIPYTIGPSKYQQWNTGYSEDAELDLVGPGGGGNLEMKPGDSIQGTLSIQANIDGRMQGFPGNTNCGYATAETAQGLNAEPLSGDSVKLTPGHVTCSIFGSGLDKGSTIQNGTEHFRIPVILLRK